MAHHLSFSELLSIDCDGMSQDLLDRELLGVGWDASPPEVRSAYHRRSLQSHPDKTGGDARAFIQLQQAYHRVQERHNNMPTRSEPSVSMLPLIFSFLTKLMAVWAALQRYKQLHVAVSDGVTVTDVTDAEAGRHTPAAILVDITVTLDDVYYARVKKLVLRVRSKHDGGMVLQKVLIPLLEHRDCYMFGGMGDSDGDLTGDVVVNLSISPHPTGARIDDSVNRYDLHVSVTTTLYEFVFGRDIVIRDMPGGDVCIRYGGREHSPLTHVVLANRGLPFASPVAEEEQCGSCRRGDLHVFFQLQMPERPAVSLVELEAMTCRQLLSALSGPESQSSGECSSNIGSSSDTDSDGVVSSWNDVSRAWT